MISLMTSNQSEHEQIVPANHLVEIYRWNKGDFCPELHKKCKQCTVLIDLFIFKTIGQHTLD